MKKLLLLGSLVGFGLGLVSFPTGCAAEPTADDRPQIVQEQGAIAPSPATIEILKPGAEPRQPLRFKPKANTQEFSTVALKATTAMKVGTESLPVRVFPTMSVDNQLTVTSVNEAGDIAADFSSSQVTISQDGSFSADVIDLLREQLKPLTQTRGAFVMDNRGSLKEFKVELPQGLDPTVQPSMQQYVDALQQDRNSVPFPEESVGIGAQWRVRRSYSSRGLAITDVTTYELLDRTGDRLTLKYTIEQQVPPQTITSPDLPASDTVELTAYKGQGYGEVIVELGRIHPPQATLTLDSTMTMRLSSPELREPLEVQMAFSTEMRIQSR